MIETRRAHYLQVLKVCEGLDGIQAMFPNLPQGVCPYVFPVQVSDNAQKWVDVLRSKGVPASRWPDLPPEALNSGCFPESVRLAQNTVLLPVHQSLTAAHMEKMTQSLKS